MAMTFTRTTEHLTLRLDAVGGHIRDHSKRVASYARTTDERNVALAHDLLEDGFATYEELVSFGMSPVELAAMLYVTRDESEVYADYIADMVDGLSDGGPAAILASCVKVYDIYDHLHPHHLSQRSDQGTQRYLDALTALTHAMRTAGVPT